VRPFLVFVQAEGASVPLEALAGQARAQLGATATVLDAGVPDVSGTVFRVGMRIRIEVVASRDCGIFRLGARAITPDDVALARAAEHRGQAAGMGELAARCHAIWTIEPEASSPEWILLELCALLAFAALGPVLPPDGATLFGVRSARERASRLRMSS
jgi:hypothetical protein